MDKLWILSETVAFELAHQSYFCFAFYDAFASFERKFRQQGTLMKTNEEKYVNSVCWAL